MRNQPGQAGFRIVTLAIAGMIMASSAGAMSSLLLIDRRAVSNTTCAAAPRSFMREQRWAHPRPDDAVKFVVVNRIVTDATNGAGIDDQAGTGDLDLTGFPDAFAAIEIVVPLLMILGVVAAAQRFAEFGPYRKLVGATGSVGACTGEDSGPRSPHGHGTT